MKTKCSFVLLFVAGVLADGVRSELLGRLEELTTVQDEFGGRLDLLLTDGVTVALAGEDGGLGGNTLEEIVNKGVHGFHATLGNTALLVLVVT